MRYNDAIEFDFEDQLRLPAQSGRSNDPRHHTIVCRHWLRGLCQKGEDCEFLHRMDLDKMPICRWGNECQVTDCQFRHIDEEDKPECAHYRQGFCRHGPGCRYRHIKLPPEDIPAIADFSLNLVPGGDGVLGIGAGGRKMGPDGIIVGGGTGGARLTRSQVEDDPEIKEMLPVTDDDNVRFFVMKALTHQHLVDSVRESRWRIRRQQAARLMEALAVGGRVIVFFSVNESRHFQGCAKMYPKDMRFGSAWDDSFSVEWLRMCELPFRQVAHIANPLNEDLPVTRSRDGQELPGDVARRLLMHLYSQPEVELDVGAEGVGADGQPPPPPGSERGQGDGSSVAESDGAAGQRGRGRRDWPDGPPGYIFPCSSETLNECLGRLLVGLSARQADSVPAAAAIVPGYLIFLLEATRGTLFGIFEAVSPLVDIIEPMAWARPGQKTPFPAQVKLKVLLEAPPVPMGDPVIREALEVWPVGRVHGPLSPEQAERLASRLAGPNR